MTPLGNNFLTEDCHGRVRTCNIHAAGAENNDFEALIHHEATYNVQSDTMEQILPILGPNVTKAAANPTISYHFAGENMKEPSPDEGSDHR